MIGGNITAQFLSPAHEVKLYLGAEPSVPGQMVDDQGRPPVGTRTPMGLLKLSLSERFPQMGHPS